MVIVVAITAISSFVVPSISDVAAILRLSLAIFAGILGAFGIPFLSPLAPLILRDFKDTFIRVPIWAICLLDPEPSARMIPSDKNSG